MNKLLTLTINNIKRLFRQQAYILALLVFAVVIGAVCRLFAVSTFGGVAAVCAAAGLLMLRMQWVDTASGYKSSLIATGVGLSQVYAAGVHGWVFLSAMGSGIILLIVGL